MNILKTTFFFALGTFGAIQGQTNIDLSFPDFAGKDYSFYLYKGMQHDTISVGTLDADGNSQISIPAQYADFRGVGALDFGREGALDIVISGERKFSIKSYVQPNGEPTMEYTGTPENQFVVDRANKISRVLQKGQLIGAVQTAYKPFEMFFVAAESEKKNIEREYADLQKATSQSSLYAARLCEIFDYMNYRPDKLTITEQEANSERADFILNRLDFGALYTSGQWSQVTSEWIYPISGDDTLLVSQTKQVLQRLSDRTVKLNLTNRLMQLFAKYGKDNLLPQLGLDNLLMPVLGQKAPAIVDNNGTQIEPKNTLLIFYDSDCGNCQNELHNVIEKYNLLRENRIDVISIAADTDKNQFDYTAQKIVWASNLCDYKGFDGANFVSYGVVGTPTLILIDKDGIIRGRYAQLKEWLN
ncbi:MAG: TlpA family protein disulfide reductase [Prevotellaceae bacterium]|jgi:peroxiredoxin|nr:TlpA family protein disulfide reductase [Prevotellaceae bacterium]